MDAADSPLIDPLNATAPHPRFSIAHLLAFTAVAALLLSLYGISAWIYWPLLVAGGLLFRLWQTLLTGNLSGVVEQVFRFVVTGFGTGMVTCIIGGLVALPVTLVLTLLAIVVGPIAELRLTIYFVVDDVRHASLLEVVLVCAVTGTLVAWATWLITRRGGCYCARWSVPLAWMVVYLPGQLQYLNRHGDDVWALSDVAELCLLNAVAFGAFVGGLISDAGRWRTEMKVAADDVPIPARRRSLTAVDLRPLNIEPQHPGPAAVPE